MFEIRVEHRCKLDYQRVIRVHPQLKADFAEAVEELMQTGRVPEEYRPHVLDNPGGNYNGHTGR